MEEGAISQESRPLEAEKRKQTLPFGAPEGTKHADILTSNPVELMSEF